MTMDDAKPLSISRQSLQRMPIYLENLKKLRAAGKSHVSAAFLAGELGLHPVQVRKDLAAVSSVDGNPRIGFALAGLIEDMEDFLGCNNANEAVVVGVGNLGRALLSYKNFAGYGLSIIAGFDSDPAVAGTTVHGKEIFSASRITELCGRFGVHIGIITTPASSAQEVCDAMLLGGIKAIWNFAPLHLNIPDDIIITNENLAASFAALSGRLRQQRDAPKL
ncbi:redox-sensing transcriptional repressor Rex [Synergistes jonesii]|nr:redox-sensing transcriptional repressor Rex [Synergistes jonesii]